MNLRRFGLFTFLYGAAVWILTFGFIVTPFRTYRVIRQALEGDEELIALTCITLLSVALGMFFAALTTRQKSRRLLVTTSTCAGFVFVAWIVGFCYLRDLFSTGVVHYFHLLYSGAITVTFLLVVSATLRRIAETHFTR